MADWLDKEFQNLKNRMKWEMKELDQLEKKAFEFETPLVNVKETPKEVVVKVKLPGMSREDIKLKITSRDFEVKAEKKKTSEIKKKGFMKSEKSYKSFYRKLALPAEVKHKKAKVDFKDGLLTVSLPKK